MLLRRVADIRGGEGIEIPEKICFFEHNPPSEPKILGECCFAKGFFDICTQYLLKLSMCVLCTHVLFVYAGEGKEVEEEATNSLI